MPWSHFSLHDEKILSGYPIIFIRPAYLRRAALALAATACGLASASDIITSRSAEIPADFTRFTIAGKAAQSLALRDMLWHHYSPSPKATLWDEWLLPTSLWPATKAAQGAEAWRATLLDRHLDPDGYVATYQHPSIAHQVGWPFPFWAQGANGFGWHFSYHNTVGPGWRPEAIADAAEWSFDGVTTHGLQEEGLALTLAGPQAVLSPPFKRAQAFESPFVQIRWKAQGLPADTKPCLEWTTENEPEFSADRRFYFDPPGESMTYTMVPMYRHPRWTGTITGLRVKAGNADAGATVTLQALFSQFDTRHNVNNPSYVIACVDYFYLTGDLNFLRGVMEKVRMAMRFMESEFGTDKDGIVTMPWIGHEGKTGLVPQPDGKVKSLSGNGVGNNYWDLLPFGQKDSYATMRHYAAALKMAEIEQQIEQNPGWNIPPSPLRRPASHWRAQAEMAKTNGNKLFWNETTGRFTLGIDSDGNQADYGYTFVNLEAIYYDFASPEHAREIMAWIDGHRRVATDTAQTADIYRWRFAPRASTLRNVEHYGWFWNAPHHIAFGDQVQDGGAVLGFSYHDIMARLRVNSADDAAARLDEILKWYGEVMNEGGYRAYYAADKKRGKLQGGGPPGGLGMDQEFFESVMVPQVMVDGFLGFRPSADEDNVYLTPNLPSAWPGLTIENFRYHGKTLAFRLDAKAGTVTVEADGKAGSPVSYRNGQPVTVPLPD